MDGLTSCLPTMSLACYSDRPGPLPLLIGATAAALSGGTAAASLWLCGPWKAHGAVGGDLFQASRAQLGAAWQLSMASLAGCLQICIPPTPLCKVENNSKSLCCPHGWRSSRAEHFHAPKQLPLPTGRRRIDASAAAIFDFVGHT